MSPIFGENPYLVDGEDVRGSVYMRGTVDGEPIQTWIPKENVGEARKIGFVPTPFVVRQKRRAAGKDIVSERKLPANVYANIPAAGFQGAVTSDPLGSAVYTLLSGGMAAPGPEGGAVVPTEQAMGSTPMGEAVRANLTAASTEALPAALQIALARFGPQLTGPGSLLTRALTTLAAQTGAQMVGQKVEGEPVNVGEAVSRGGLASPAAQTGLGIIGDVIPYLSRATGRRLTKGGLGAAEVGTEESLMGPAMRLKVKNPVTGRVESQSPRPTKEWTSAADAETKMLGDRNLALVNAATKADNAPVFDSRRLSDVVEKDIEQLSRTDIMSGAPEQASREVLARLTKVLGINLTRGGEALPMNTRELFDVTRKAGDYASDALRARLAATEAGKAIPAADQTEVLARKIWAEGKAMLTESGEAGATIAVNAQRQRDLIDVNNHMKLAGMRTQPRFEPVPPRSSIPTGTALMEFGYRPDMLTRPATSAVLQAAGATTPLFSALNPPRTVEPERIPPNTGYIGPR